jgi:hypothetical protein
MTNNQINNNNNNTFYTIMAITKARLINNQYSVIASSHYYLQPTPFSWNSQTMIDRLNTVYDNKLKIIIISNFVTKINFYNLGIGSNSIYSHYTVYTIPFKEFYNKTLIEAIFLNNIHINHTIIMFQNLDYRSIVENLAMFNFIISGGSNNKKHILSPIQLRLARFVIAISSFSDDEVVNSFHFEKSNEDRGTDWTSKEAKYLISKLNTKMRNEFIYERNKIEKIENCIAPASASNNISEKERN